MKQSNLKNEMMCVFYGFTAECPNEEVMGNGAVIPDSHVTDGKGKPAPESKPGMAGYEAVVPANNDKTLRGDKPSLKVRLTSESSKEAKQVTKMVLQGNVGRVTVLGKKAGDKKTKVIVENAKVPENGGAISLPNPSALEEIQVVFENPKKTTDKKYKVVLSVFACGHFPGKVFSKHYNHLMSTTA